MTFLQLFTIFHTALSIVAIIAGILVMKGLIVSHGRQLWTLLFLVTAAATTITGFFFPYKGMTPALILGVISIFPITIAILARYRHRLSDSWRGTYVITAVLTLYFNCFVLIAQAFQKVPSLHELAPTQTEPAFQVAQLTNLVLFVLIGIVSFKKYHPKRIASESGYISPYLEKE